MHRLGISCLTTSLLFICVIVIIILFISATLIEAQYKGHRQRQIFLRQRNAGQCSVLKQAGTYIFHNLTYEHPLHINTLYLHTVQQALRVQTLIESSE